MPLRVAERDGYIKAVNGCGDCSFRQVTHAATNPTDECGHPEGKNAIKVKLDCIPVWCPLPTPTMKHMLEHK